MKLKRINDEVYYDLEGLVQVNAQDIFELKAIANGNPRKRSRLCAHPSPEDSLHEMLIVHEKNAYVRPHRHLGRSESFHVIEGLADVVLFEENGEIQRIIQIGNTLSGRTFYYRMPAGVFHSLIIRSEVLVFHEVTSGPFRTDSTEFPPWAPVETDHTVEQYIAEIDRKIIAFQSI